MRRCSFPAALLLVTLASAACSSGGSKSGTTSTTNAVRLSSSSWETAKPYPSKTAKMVCQAEVRGDIVHALRVPATTVVPTWNKQQHLYSCTYKYPHGKIVLSVKELSNEQETTAYYDATRRKYGTKKSIFGLGQGAWLLKNADVMVRKDYKVLLVDVRAIPANFAVKPADAASTIAGVILGCWPGA